MKIEQIIDYNAITTRKKITSRGGGIEIDLTTLGYKGHVMSAYQNYLGGGLSGSINNSSTISNWMNVDELCQIALGLVNHYHAISGQDMDLKELQKLPSSAY